MLSVAFLDVTLGNILTLLGCAVTMILAWQKTIDRIDTMKERIDEHSEKLNALTRAGMPEICKVHSAQLEDMQSQLRMLPVIANDVQWIKSALKQRGDSE